MGRLHARSRRHVPSDRHRVGAMVYRSIRQQEAGATQYHRAPALEYSLQESAPREYQVAETQGRSQQAASRFSENRSGGKLMNARPAPRKRTRAGGGRSMEKDHLRNDKA